MGNNVIDKYCFDGLCNEYGYILDDSFREKIEEALNAPVYDGTSFYPEEENTLAVAEFLDFLRSVGDEIVMEGTIQHHRKEGEINNTPRKHKINNVFLKNRLLSFMNSLLTECKTGFEYDVDDAELFATISILKAKSNMKKKMPEGAKRGYKVWLVYNMLWDAGDFHQQNRFTQKEWCFIYDCARLAGWNIKHIGNGFKSVVGKEKATYVRNWFNAYQKQIESR